VNDRPQGPPAPLLVFAQRPDARVELDAWDAHAARFLSIRIGLAEPLQTSPDAAGQGHESVRFVVAPAGIPPGIRRASARPRDDDDLVRARASEAAQARGGASAAGLATLAARCPMVWLVDRDAPDDALAWALAVVLSSVLLGPILDEDSGRLFGARGGRAILDALRGPVK
jgi:hypothetical protein